MTQAPRALRQPDALPAAARRRSVAAKFDALADELDVRVLASALRARCGRRRSRSCRRSPRRSTARLLARAAAAAARELRALPAATPSSARRRTRRRGAARRAGSRACRRRVVVEVHGDWRTATRLYGSPLRRLLGPARRRASPRAALRRADAVRTVSPFTAGARARARRRACRDFPDVHGPRAVRRRRRAAARSGRRALFVGVLERVQERRRARGGVAARRAARARTRRCTSSARARARDVAEALVRDCPAARWDARAPARASRRRARRGEAARAPVALRGHGRACSSRRSAAAARSSATRAGAIPDLVEDGVSGLLVAAGRPRPRSPTRSCACSPTARSRERLGDGARAAAAPLAADAGGVRAPDAGARRRVR